MKNAAYYLKIVYVFCMFFLIVTDRSLLNAQDEDLSVLRNWYQYTDKENALYHHLAEESFQYLSERTVAIAQLSTKSDWEKRQKAVREKLMKIIGPFPEKTPLNPHITETLIKDGYKMEKLYYESQPDFFVTAGLFIPDNLKGKTPAVIYCSGHSDDGFRSIAYQRVILNLVNKGFIVLAFDPVSQGERWQYLDPDFGISKIGGPTLEHSYPGAQCFLNGSSLARYMIWDGIRAIDYLLTREEVDPERIGITGRSGGGTQSSYIAACDDRILAAAPEGFITSTQRLLESIGPQDAEQNFYHGLVNGIDHADLLEVRAPKPALVITTTRDFFSIQGARETAAEIQRVYQAYGQPENFQMIEDDDVHASTKANRERMYAFFQKYLNLPGDSSDENVTYLSREELRVTTTGQVMKDLGGESIFSLNLKQVRDDLEALRKKRRVSNRKPDDIVARAVMLSGYRRPDPKRTAVFTGRYQREGYTIEKYFIRGEGDYPLPFLLVKPNDPGPFPVILYLHDDDKQKEALPGGQIEWFVNKGYMVIAPDLLGRGEIGPERFQGDAYDFKPGRAPYNIWFLSVQNARSIVGIQAADVVRLVNYVKSRDDINKQKIFGVARGEICPVLSHAAAFDNSIARIALFDPLVSYQSLVLNTYYLPKFMPAAVAGAIPDYDLADLYTAIAPRRLLLVNVVNQIDQLLGTSDREAAFESVREIYGSYNAGDAFVLRDMESYQSLDDVLGNWLND
jgi:dienelactone hydrolase